MQTIFKVVAKSAKSGIMSAIVIGVGRAIIGEAMAILLVAGNAVFFHFHLIRYVFNNSHRFRNGICQWYT